MENQRNQQTATFNFTSLPIELHHDIFCRLPSKPLHICKSVSKQWHSIITSPEFIRFHLRLHSLSSSPRSNRLLVLNSKQYLSTLELDNIHNTQEPIISKHNTNIIHPKDSTGSLLLVSTCNGLVCLKKNTFSERKDRLYIYNPFTRRLWDVPVLDDSRRCWNGLGFDSAAHDFKILRIPGLTEPSFGRVVEFPSRHAAYLFSFRSGSWKRVEDFKYKWSKLSHLNSRPCVFINGYFHWAVVLDVNSRQGSTSIGIGRFDVSSEDYSLMELPHVLSKGHGDGPGYVELEVFDGCLSLQVMKYHHNGSHQFDVWAMKEYGVSESWSRMFHIENSRVAHEVWTKALAYSTTGDRVLVLRNVNYYWYDTEGKELEFAGYTELRQGIETAFCESIVSAGSLISPYCDDKQLRRLGQ